MIEVVEVNKENDDKTVTKSVKKPVKKLTSKQYWRRVGSNLSQNLALIIYLVVIYLVVNFICGAVIEWQQAHWPVDKRYVLLYNQFLHLVVFGSFCKNLSLSHISHPNQLILYHKIYFKPLKITQNASPLLSA